METRENKDWEKLNEYQKEAVLDDSPACVVNANVGSGKTTVLIAKVLYLYLEKKVPLEEGAGKLKTVSPDGQLVQDAKRSGISFGDCAEVDRM